MPGTLTVVLIFALLGAAYGALLLISAPLIILFTTLMAGAWIGYGMLLEALMRRAGSFPEPVLDDASSRTA